MGVKNDIKKVVKYIILVHIVLFYIQFFNVYITDNYIDLIYPFTGEESRYSNYFADRSILFFIKYRVTGLYVEPSTYTAAMLCLLLSGYILNINKLILFLAYLTLLLNFSTAGIVFFILIGMFFMIKVLIQTKLKSLLFFLVLLLLYSFLHSEISDFIIDFTNKFKGSMGSRFSVLNAYLTHPVYGFNIFGYGLFNISPEFYKNAAYFNGAVNDSGLLAFLFMKFGVTSILIFIYILLQAKDLTEIGIVISIFMSKISFIHPVFIMAMIILLTNRYANKYLNSYMERLLIYFNFKKGMN